MAAVAQAAESAPAKLPALPSADFRPDPASVQRDGAGYRYPQAGWIVLHIEGEPYERGYQHGRLLAAEIADYVDASATSRSPKAPAEAWRDLRTLVNALFLRRYDAEYLEEMKGIADGAAAAGAKFDGRPIDLLDIVALNAEHRSRFPRRGPGGHADRPGRHAAFASRPTARLSPRTTSTAAPSPPPGRPRPTARSSSATSPCSTSTCVRHFNVWLDIKPKAGHRVLMQTYPGGIKSGLDYYMNDAGLLVLRDDHRARPISTPTGMPLASRIRRAMQYADSIDKAVEILHDRQQRPVHQRMAAGRHQDQRDRHVRAGHAQAHKLWRSSKNEWFGGTEGFYWGCNNTKDLEVRLETVPSLDGQPANVVFHPRRPRRAWLQLFDKTQGQDRRRFRLRGLHHAAAGRLPLVRRQVHHHGAGQGAEDLGPVRPAAGPHLGRHAAAAAATGRHQAAGEQRLGPAHA